MAVIQDVVAMEEEGTASSVAVAGDTTDDAGAVLMLVQQLTRCPKPSLRTNYKLAIVLLMELAIKENPPELFRASQAF